MDYLDRIPDYTEEEFDEATVLCCCLEYVGDNPNCQVHHPAPEAGQVLEKEKE